MACIAIAYYRYGRHCLYSHCLYSHGLYSYGLHSYGLFSYDLYGYGLNSYGPCIGSGCLAARVIRVLLCQARMYVCRQARQHVPTRMCRPMNRKEQRALEWLPGCLAA